MKLVVGLGNPGDKYIDTRHNVGFMLLDALAKKIKTPDWTKSKKFNSFFTKKGEIVLSKPTTFMNKSGESVRKLTNHYKVDVKDIWIVHDDLDIALGNYKIQKGKGPREHNGVWSVEQELGGTEFWRVRVGVDNREVDERTPGEKYVLQKFEEEELAIIENKKKEIVNRLIKLIFEE